MVVSNLLENAIQACLKLSDGKPIVHFICHNMGRLLLEIENPCAQGIAFPRASAGVRKGGSLFNSLFLSVKMNLLSVKALFLLLYVILNAEICKKLTAVLVFRCADFHLDKPRSLDVGVCYWPKKISK
ncbi:MAG TPA: GHKL domain-containing protein [Clostridia bacterium]|nr:GHKL domain-containing protein [Clostridia bacterium]